MTRSGTRSRAGSLEMSPEFIARRYSAALARRASAIALRADFGSLDLAPGRPEAREVEPLRRVACASLRVGVARPLPLTFSNLSGSTGTGAGFLRSEGIWLTHGLQGQHPIECLPGVRCGVRVNGDAVDQLPGGQRFQCPHQ